MNPVQHQPSAVSDDESTEAKSFAVSVALLACFGILYGAHQVLPMMWGPHLHAMLDTWPPLLSSAALVLLTVSPGFAVLCPMLNLPEGSLRLEVRAWVVRQAVALAVLAAFSVAVGHVASSVVAHDLGSPSMPNV